MTLRLALAALALAAAGCAGGGAPATTADPRDPWEGFNRGVYGFNQAFDDALARPVATAYRDVVHDEIRSRVRTFFSNLADPLIGVNNLLQGKLEDGLLDWVRFAFNSTVGLLGLHDVASDMGIEKHNEDFGQTFGRWGAQSGPYLVLPIFGSSSVRDGTGTAFDIYTDPMRLLEPNVLRNSMVVVRGVQYRADLLDASRLLEEAALDRYVFQRDAYFQRRRSLIYDGQPPRDDSSRWRLEPEAGAPAPEEVPPNVFLPRVPRNYEAVLSADAPARR
ncbi:MAG: MlaA family lipoprotein [Betaproteobacteria bacterium]